MHPTRRSYSARARAVGGSQDLRRGVLMLVAPRAWSGVAVDALRGRRREPAASRQRLSCARWSNAGRSCDFERKTSRSFASWSSRGSSATRARAPVFEPFGRPTRNQRAGCMDRNGRRSCSRAAGGCGQRRRRWCARPRPICTRRLASSTPTRSRRCERQPIGSDPVARLFPGRSFGTTASARFRAAVSRHRALPGARLAAGRRVRPPA
jgi:hypothetical protein